MGIKKYHINEGDKFNRLTCIRFSHIGEHNRSYFVFKCDCGKTKTILGSIVKSGNTMSCGCYGMEIKKLKRLDNNYSEVTNVFLQYKRHAKSRNIKFELDREIFDFTIRQNCYYCGIKPSNFKFLSHSNEGFYYNGIDRINNKKHYHKDNIVPCCSKCNIAKSDMDSDEFLIWVQSVYNHLFNDL